jgi:predicted metal-dependent hydrolase
MLLTQPIPYKQQTMLTVPDVSCPVELRRSPRAKRFSLKVSHTERAAILTLPNRGRVEDASAFLARHADWLKRQIERLPQPIPFVDGAIVPVRGEFHRLSFVGQMKYHGVVWVEEFDAMPCSLKPGHRSDPGAAWRFDFTGAGKVSQDFLPRLCVSGGATHASRRFMEWLKSEARRDLSQRVRVHAETLNCAPKRISIRDQSTRWGSCSTTGTISFSWRLIFAPPFVLDYVAAHEVAHLREMNHGPRFWRLVRDAIPDMQRARVWLKAHGAELHRFGALQ